MTDEETRIIHGHVRAGRSIWQMVHLTGWGEKRVRRLLDEAGLKAPKPLTKRQVYQRFNMPSAQ